MATITQKFGKRIKQLRKKLGLSQEKLAELARLDYSYLNMIEAGKKNPSLKRIHKLARTLKVSLQELFSFDK
ncbi:MAG: helix-turn-helix domain-containing protein [Patescibacteria group bacterium]|nr:helix-turn-helix domain-containing protein [Patescibacteria group bacterium]